MDQKPDHKPTPPVIALLDSHAALDLITPELTRLGYSDDDVSVMMSEFTKAKQQRAYRQQQADSAPAVVDDAIVGSAWLELTGTDFDAAQSAIVLIGSHLILPGMGLIVTGPLAASFASVEATEEGVASALHSAGIKMETARFLEEGVLSGKVLMCIHVRSSQEASELRQLFAQLAQSLGMEKDSPEPLRDLPH